MDRSAEDEPDALRRQLAQNVAGVRHGSRQSVDSGDDEGVAGSAAGQRKSESRSVTVGAGQSVVDVDTVVTDTEGSEGEHNQTLTPNPDAIFMPFFDLSGGPIVFEVPAASR